MPVCLRISAGGEIWHGGKASLGRLFIRRRRANIRPQPVTGDLSDPFDIGQPLSGHTIPHRDGGAIDSETPRDLGDQASLRPNEIHTFQHAAMLSTTEQTVASPISSVRLSVTAATLPPMSDLATIIRNARRTAGYSQRVLAGKVDVKPSAVAQWETNVTKPKLSNRVDLAALLDIPIGDLLPEASGEAVVSQDPQIVMLVRKFEKLPPRLRDAIFKQVLATSESLEEGRDIPSPASPKEKPTAAPTRKTKPKRSPK